MAVKRKHEKERRSAELRANSVKIKCCYCDAKDDCRLRAQKEKSEKMEIVTFCTTTPNRPKSFARKTKANTVNY